MKRPRWSGTEVAVAALAVATVAAIVTVVVLADPGRHGGPFGGKTAGTGLDARSPGPPAGTSPRPVPAPIYGVTVDSVANIADIVAGAEAFGRVPTTRVVLDYLGTPNSVYVMALKQLAPHSYVMAELLDSSDMPAAEKNLPGEPGRVAGYLSDLGRYVDIWEVGNEINGDWTCPTTPCDAAGYQTGADLTVRAYRQVAGAGYPTALTLYYNAGCPSDPAELDPVSYTSRYLSGPAAVEMRRGLRYVLLSYYETQCEGQRPSSRTLGAYLQKLRSLYPNAQMGIGEVGLPDPIGNPNDLTQAKSIIKYYYGLDPGLTYYVGGYFWWYYGEDALPYQGNPLWRAIDDAFVTEK